MITALETIKSWFVRGAKPTAKQFSDAWDSFWHKNDELPLTDKIGFSDMHLPQIEVLVTGASVAPVYNLLPNALYAKVKGHTDKLQGELYFQLYQYKRQSKHSHWSLDRNGAHIKGNVYHRTKKAYVPAQRTGTQNDIKHHFPLGNGLTAPLVFKGKTLIPKSGTSTDWIRLVPDLGDNINNIGRNFVFEQTVGGEHFIYFPETSGKNGRLRVLHTDNEHIYNRASCARSKFGVGLVLEHPVYGVIRGHITPLQFTYAYYHDGNDGYKVKYGVYAKVFGA